MIAEELTTAIKGSEFIVKDTNAPDVFIPEEYTEEQNMIYGMCRDFLNQEISQKIKINQQKHSGQVHYCLIEVLWV